MIPYLLSFVIGLGVGGLYALLGVASPAPPIIALLGLLGMVTGETAVKYIRTPHKEITHSVAELCHSKSFMNEDEKNSSPVG
ncbi:DUF1427 family protein [Entomobacter blattae]|uniref:XapX domain-containing protein n=1 Tax=Entomobacter blattae TaxID=2762277 RepID=A0A7H1NSG7_9PROT|nr:DUF1427 family protein [Entomobacter blattae]QNT78727.1 hypothetical protein JGUZn3_15040 [Entomobacter blattae]